jgi:hypothetical protein
MTPTENASDQFSKKIFHEFIKSFPWPTLTHQNVFQFFQ